MVSSIRLHIRNSRSILSEKEYDCESSRKIALSNTQNYAQKFFRLLLKHDAYFLVLCPGTNTQVGEIKTKTPFMDYPFISTEGGAVELVKTLKVHLSDTEFMPAILQVASNLAVDAVYIGRGPGQYFHQFLLKRLIEARYKQEMNGIVCLCNAQEIINQLKRKTIKCQQGKMASNWINLTRPLFTKNSQVVVATASSDCYDEPMNDTETTSRLLDVLPLEILEIILDYVSSDISSLVKASRTCRKFYIAICNVLIKGIRRQMAYLKPALPQENNQVVWDQAQVANESLDRWSGGQQEGIPYRELVKRVSDTRNLLGQISEWTRHWSPRNVGHNISNNSSRFRRQINNDY